MVAKNRPEHLRSTYRIASPSQIVSELSFSGQSVSTQANLECMLLELQTDIGRYQLRGLPLGPAQSDSCQLCVSDERVQLIAPAHFITPMEWTNQGPTTFRWRYQISLAAHAD